MRATEQFFLAFQERDPKLSREELVRGVRSAVEIYSEQEELSARDQKRYFTLLQFLAESEELEQDVRLDALKEAACLLVEKFEENEENFFTEDDLQAARGFVQKARLLSPEDNDDVLGRVFLLISRQQDDVHRVIRSLERAVEEEEWEAAYDLGMRYFHEEEREAAIRYLKLAVDHEIQQGDGAFLLGQLYAETGQKEDAIFYLKMAKTNGVKQATVELENLDGGCIIL